MPYLRQPDKTELTYEREIAQLRFGPSTEVEEAYQGLLEHRAMAV